MTPLPNLEAKIVIVGCGISGIGAALKLIKNGFKNVRIIEATGRSGGRIRTGRLGSNIVEIGANWIHGPSQGNPVFRLACQHGLLDPADTTEENQAMDVGGHPPWVPTFLRSSGGEVEPETLAPALEVFSQVMETVQGFSSGGGEPVASVGEFIRTELPRLAKDDWMAQGEGLWNLRMSFVNTMLKGECCINGTPTMEDLSLRACGLYQTLPGLDCTFPRGYEGLVDCLMRQLPEGTVAYNTPVCKVHWADGKHTGTHPHTLSQAHTHPVQVECASGEVFPADHVIVTVPLGYLKKHHTTLLSPPLPGHKAQSVERMGFGTNNKIFLEFAQPFWSPTTEVIYLLWEDEEHLRDTVPNIHTHWARKLFGFTVLKPTERYGHVLCGWIAGHESEYMESLPEAEVLNTVTQVLRRFTGIPSLSVCRMLRSQWFSEVYTCGSYSYPATGCSAVDIAHLAEPLPPAHTHTQPLQVLFAGEATHDSYFSTVHGALMSGWREADRLIAHHSSASASSSSSSSQLSSKL
ncbi:peroxisomal N(1)-acetyl-spermine/spermidine oxidase-like isoform X2 [Engraulis encrasicolus]|uniref:peroxisomal N(1)-acetyl-spermine/spermidine oxidase-like isoform X2 n=1 Tax=Engraulis encrasicolus TaxID=184585 RepID=UPI002FD02784